MPALISRFRRLARDVQQDLWPTPEFGVLQELERRAGREPRRTPGRISIAPYQFDYADAMTTWPQWDDIFIHEALAFTTTTSEPRILDCGANIGMASLFFKRRYPRARITAFEADPDLAVTCRRNLSANGAGDVDVRDAAVWTEHGAIEFVCEGADSGSIASIDPSISGRKAIVPAVRLRDYLREPIDLLKLDIEGAELAVLQDCRDQLSQVRSLTIDLHEFDAGHRQTGAIFDLLTGEGFTFDMRGLAPLPWRARPAPSPFPDPSPVWAVTVRAWRN